MSLHVHLIIVGLSDPEQGCVRRRSIIVVSKPSQCPGILGTEVFGTNVCSSPVLDKNAVEEVVGVT